MTEASRVQKLLTEQNDEINRLRTRIEKLEAAIEDMAQYISKADWIQLKPETHQVWDLGEIDD